MTNSIQLSTNEQFISDQLGQYIKLHLWHNWSEVHFAVPSELDDAPLTELAINFSFL